MMTMRALVKNLTPPLIWRALSAIRHRRRSGFFGDYCSFSEAMQACGVGYSAPAAIDYARSRARVCGPLSSLELQLLAALQTVRPHSVLDFGGALGTHYFRLNRLVQAKAWRVVELSETAAAGQAEFADGTLTFSTDLAPAGVVIASGSVQYVAEPYATIRDLAQMAPYLVIDRLPLLERDRLTVQRVDPSLFSGAFPAWILSESGFARATSSFELVMTWHVQERVIIEGMECGPFRGFLFRT